MIRLNNNINNFSLNQHKIFYVGNFLIGLKVLLGIIGLWFYYNYSSIMIINNHLDSDYYKRIGIILTSISLCSLISDYLIRLNIIELNNSYMLIYKIISISLALLTGGIITTIGKFVYAVTKGLDSIESSYYLKKIKLIRIWSPEELFTYLQKCVSNYQIDGTKLMLIINERYHSSYLKAVRMINNTDLLKISKTCVSKEEAETMLCNLICEKCEEILYSQYLDSLELTTNNKEEVNKNNIINFIKYISSSSLELISAHPYLTASIGISCLGALLYGVYNIYNFTVLQNSVKHAYKSVEKVNEASTQMSELISTNKESAQQLANVITTSTELNNSIASVNSTSINNLLETTKSNSESIEKLTELLKNLDQLELRQLSNNVEKLSAELQELKEGYAYLEKVARLNVLTPTNQLYLKQVCNRLGESENARYFLDLVSPDSLLMIRRIQALLFYNDSNNTPMYMRRLALSTDASDGFHLLSKLIFTMKQLQSNRAINMSNSSISAQANELVAEIVREFFKQL